MYQIVIRASAILALLLGAVLFLSPARAQSLAESHVEFHLESRPEFHAGIHEQFSAQSRLSARGVALNLQESGSLDEPGPTRLEAIAKSVLIPGWGQWETGHTGRGQFFIAAEVGIWTAFSVFQVQGHLRRESYIELAEVLAGVQDASGREDDYYRNVGRFMSSTEYMQDVRRDARARFGDDLEARNGYEAQNAIPPDRQWQWTNEADLQRYKDKRSGSKGAFQNARYMIAAAVLNRLLSAMDAARSVEASSSKKVAFHVRPDPDDGGPLRFCLAFPIP